VVPDMVATVGREELELKEATICHRRIYVMPRRFGSVLWAKDIRGFVDRDISRVRFEGWMKEKGLITQPKHKLAK